MRWAKKPLRLFKTRRVLLPRQCFKCKDTCWLEIMRTAKQLRYLPGLDFWTERHFLCMICGFHPDRAEDLFKEVMGKS